MPWQQLQLPSPIEPSNATATLGTTNQRRGVPLSDGASGGADEPRVFKGTGNFAGQPKSSPGAASSVVGSDGVQLNLVQASVAEAAKTILGDLLGANYVISDKIKFAVTIQTAKPVSKDALVAIFEAVLSADGAALVYENEVYKIVPSAEAQAAGSPIRTSSKQSTQPGHGTQVIPLRHVAAPEMERILRSVAPQSRVLRTDAARNMIVVSGSRADLANIVDVVSVFDVDWMRGMSFGFFPIETNDPEAIAQELDTIFANDRDGPSKGVVRFVPEQAAEVDPRDLVAAGLPREGREMAETHRPCGPRDREAGARLSCAEPPGGRTRAAVAASLYGAGADHVASIADADRTTRCAGHAVVE